MSQSTKTALAVVAVVVLAGAFWLLLLGPKREKASELAEQTTSLQGEVATEQQRAAAAVVAKREFPRYYSELVLLGKAVPAEAATPSLLVQLNGIGARADTSFQSIALSGGEEGTSAAAPTEEVGAAPPPIGSTVGPAGLSAMPYDLKFIGGFFDIADFIKGLDSLVQTKDGVVVAKGRLVTIDGFTLEPSSEAHNPALDELEASFQVSTYVTPPGQGLTAGATPSGPATSTIE